MALPGMRRSVQDGGSGEMLRWCSGGAEEEMGLAIQLKNLHAPTDSKPQSSGLPEST
jgi:hypothetical protein